MHFENERWCKMGCYKMVCAATNTTINEGDEVVLFYFINSLVESNPVYSDEKMETFFVPLVSLLFVELFPALKHQETSILSIITNNYNICYYSKFLLFNLILFLFVVAL